MVTVELRTIATRSTFNSIKADVDQNINVKYLRKMDKERDVVFDCLPREYYNFLSALPTFKWQLTRGFAFLFRVLFTLAKRSAIKCGAEDEVNRE